MANQTKNNTKLKINLTVREEQRNKLEQDAVATLDRLCMRRWWGWALNNCYRESSPFVPTRRGAEDICGVLTRMRQFTADPCDLAFSGGEPLIHPGFRAIAEHASNLGYENRLLTNGILMDEKLADFVCLHFSRIQISLDSPDAQENSQFRGGNFTKVLRAITLLSERNANLTVQVTVGQNNKETSTHISEILPPNLKVRYTPILPMGRGRRQESQFISNDEFTTLNRTITKGKVSQRLMTTQGSRSCHAGRGSVSIADNGDVYPCHLFHYDEFRMGNVYEQDIREIIFSDELLEYSRSMDVELNNEDCSKCPIRLLCNGGCKANTLHGTGTMHGVDIHCSFLKSVFFKDMYLACAAAEAAPRNAEPVEPCQINGSS
jgi:radical SAM protein with 4Fe4S-binding SPASM domain